MSNDKRSGPDTVERTVAQIRESVQRSGGRIDERQVRRDVERTLVKRDQREGK